MQDLSEESPGAHDQPRKRPAIGDGISAGSGSPYREDSASPPPRRSKARPTSAQYSSTSETGLLQQDALQRPQVGGKKLWNPEHDSVPARSSVADPSNIAALQAQRTRTQAIQSKGRKNYPSLQNMNRSQAPQHTPSILGRNTSAQSFQAPLDDDNLEIVLQPETRPISQEQLVAEVKGIYAGLVMVEAKCIEVDNKQVRSIHLFKRSISTLGTYFKALSLSPLEYRSANVSIGYACSS